MHVQDSPDSNLGEIWKRNAHKINLIGFAFKKEIDRMNRTYKKL